MLSFTPKNNEFMTVVQDKNYYSVGDGPITDVACYSSLQGCFKKDRLPGEMKIWSLISIPFVEADAITCEYIQFIKDLGGFTGTIDPQFEYKDNKFYFTFKINPRTFSYRRLLLLGTMLRGVSAFWYIAVFFAHFRKLYPEGPLLNLWVLAHAKFNYDFKVEHARHYSGHAVFFGEEVVKNSKLKLKNPFDTVPITDVDGIHSHLGRPLGYNFTEDYSSSYLNAKALTLNGITSETLRKDYGNI